MKQRWCIITCEYPPMPGGVSDHTYLLARALADAGDTVDVWAPPGMSSAPSSPGVAVHALPSLFRLDALRVLRRVMREQAPDTRILIQYVPTGFGWRMLNVPFAVLLFNQRRRGLDIYFHEVGFPISRRERLRRNLAGAVHVVMNWFAVRAASRVFVAIPEWTRRLERLSSRAENDTRVVSWVPVPSNVPAVVDADRVQEVRRTLLSNGCRNIIGHFGTFGRYHAAVLGPIFARILDADPDRMALLAGRNSQAWCDAFLARRPDLAGRVVATGGLLPEDISVQLAACDVLVQPYDDGVSARRGSLMAGLALGRPVVTNQGEVTSGIWFERDAVELTASDSPEAMADAVTTLLSNPVRRTEIGARGRALHTELFALEHGIATLRDAVARAPASPRPGAGTIVRSRMHPRVLMLHTTLPTPGRKPGGVEVAVHRLANALTDLGVKVTVASLSAPPSDARYQYRALFSHSTWLRDSRLGRLVILPLLLNLISLRDTDVVHYHGDDWFVLRRPRASVRTLHGSALREAQQATRWQRRAIQYAVYPFERLAGRLATVTVAVGQGTADLHGITRVIGNGVDPELFVPGAKSPTPLLLYVGVWEGRKRGRWTYEVFTQSIAPRHPNVDLRFIADVEPPPHPRVHFERFPADVALAKAYREAWVFALPSTYEGFGIPYLEAMASGTPVVATPNEGANELLQSGRSGVLVEDERFADSIIDLLNDEGERQRMTDAGLARARDFAWPDIARAYQRLYGEAMTLHHDAVGDA